MLQEDFQLSKLQLRQDCEECEALAFLVCYGKYMQTFATLNMETINHHIVYFSQNVNKKTKTNIQIWNQTKRLPVLQYIFLA